MKNKQVFVSFQESDWKNPKCSFLLVTHLQDLTMIDKLLKYSGGGVLRDSRLLIGWKWRHRALQSLLAAVSEGFEHLKYAENHQINQFNQNN